MSPASPAEGAPRERPGTGPRDGSRLQLLVDLAASAALLIATVVFVGGWMLDVEMLRRLPAGGAEMKANTALGVAAGALALLLLRPGASRRKRMLAMAGADLLAAIGTLSTLQWTFGFDLGIDLLLFADPSSGRSGNLPGRPALGTALAFVLLAFAIWTLPRSSGRARTASLLASSLAGFVALAGALAQVVDDRTFHDSMRFGVMALPTATTLFLLATSVVAAIALRGRLDGRPAPPYAGLTLGFATALGLLATITWLDWRSGVRSQRAADWLAHTHEARAVRGLLLADMLDIEVGQRSYLLTGRPEFREMLDDALARESRRERELADLTVDPEQRTHLTTIRPLIAERIALARRTLEIHDTLGAEAATREVATLRGKSLTDAIREILRAMDVRSQELLAERAAAARREQGNERRIFLLGIVVSGGLLSGVFVLLLREIRLRRRSQEELDRFFTLSIDLLGIAGSDGHFKRLNPAFGQTLGYDTETLLTRPFLDFVHPDDRAATEAEMARLDRGEPTLAFENRYRASDGSWKWISWRVQPFLAEGLLYATARDVTQQKRASEDLRAANSELESFSYSVSHDLRAPLRSIDGFSQILLEEHSTQLDEQGRSHLARVRAAAQRMGELIDDLLQLSRLGRAQLLRREVDLSQLARETLAELQRADPDRSVAWEIEPGVFAFADPNLMRIVFENLLGNAWKFTRDRSRAEIRFRTEKTDGRTIYRIADNGAGFDMTYAARLFTPFQRLHSTRDFAGTGIGLAIVARIIRRHEGDIRAEAEVGKGATFSFTLEAGPTFTNTRESAS